MQAEVEDELWVPLVTLEAQLQSVVGELREMIAPQVTVQKQMALVRGMLERIEAELGRVEVALAVRPALQEQRGRERLSTHRNTHKGFQQQLQQLKPRIRQNLEEQSRREREDLLRLAGQDSGAQSGEKRTLLREAERGTQALHEASQMMRQVCAFPRR